MSTVLVVDTDRANRELVQAALHSCGHFSLEAEDGLEALRMLSTVRPDLVLSNPTMSGMSGFQLAQSIRADPTISTIPLVFYSPAYIANELTCDAQRDDMNPGIGKNGDLHALIEAVEDALAAAITGPTSDPAPR